ncbi:hypothetical protein EYF80_017682 [Liparis tanakae]|uniref:Uncharacterized protein n=1 Tax=Liparis tanakae TaxID=230148 RepID=A0A4Z2I3R0_9TELE|nr:hypothetical protein EYF80_017682 [Liparis tanakae]
MELENSHAQNNGLNMKMRSDDERLNGDSDAQSRIQHTLKVTEMTREHPTQPSATRLRRIGVFSESFLRVWSERHIGATTPSMTMCPLTRHPSPLH